MKYYITKYALTQGVYEVNGCAITDWSPIKTIRVDGSCGGTYYHGSEFHETREAALDKAEKIRLAKIESLKRQIRKLENVKFV